MVNPVSVSSTRAVVPDSLSATGLGSSSATEKVSFKDLLEKSLGEINDLQSVAEEQIRKFATGEVTDVRDVMVAVEEANLAFQFTLQMRNKIVEAYQELSRIQV